MRSARNLKAQVVISVFLVMLGLTAVAGSKTIYVDVGATGVDKGSGADFQFDIQYPSIQAAIDAAVGGDVIILAPGTFGGDGNRDLDFKGKAITLCSTDPSDPNIVAATIIDCNGSEGHCHRGFYFHSGEDANSVVEGLTITNGFHGRGGGILCIASSPIIRNNIITGNRIEYDYDGGGGIGCWDGASPLIVGNTISDNHCEPGGGGGGICCRRASSPTITDNIIAGNSASQGSGILCYGSPTISNCTFIGNTTPGMGGGILIDGSPILTNCTFSGNSAGSGGAIYNYHCSPTLTNCRFIANSARYTGGGMYNSESSPMVTDCNFSGNSADWGGGIYNVWSSPMLASCIFSGNSASSRGGGIQNEYSDTTVTSCTFTGNSASYGGGMSQDSGNVMVTHCTFSNNFANYGGGMINLQRLTLANCTFTGNSAIHGGGGIFNDYGTPAINNCTFSGNSAELGGGMYCYYSDSSTLTNCILWGNTADSGSQIALDYSYNQSISYCDIQGGWSGDGNIDADPCFADPNNGNYHLKSQGGRWEPSSKSWIHDNVTSPCIDAGNMAGPIGIEPFPNGGIVNMGAYGGTAEASKSYFGKPVCKTIVAGDINGDCRIDFKDFAFMAAHWLENNSP